MENSNDQLKNIQQINLHPRVAQAMGSLYFENYLLKNDLAVLKQEVSKIQVEARRVDKKIK